jgi:hypothetical protein
MAGPSANHGRGRPAAPDRAARRNSDHGNRRVTSEQLDQLGHGLGRVVELGDDIVERVIREDQVLAT